MVLELIERLDQRHPTTHILSVFTLSVTIEKRESELMKARSSKQSRGKKLQTGNLRRFHLQLSQQSFVRKGEKGGKLSLMEETAIERDIVRVELMNIAGAVGAVAVVDIVDVRVDLDIAAVDAAVDNAVGTAVPVPLVLAVVGVGIDTLQTH